MSDRTSLQQHLPYYRRRYTVYRTPQPRLEWKMNHPRLCAHLFAHEQRCFPFNSGHSTLLMGNTFSSNTTEALLNHASETGQWLSSAQNMSGNPTLYKSVLVRHPFRIFSFSQTSTRCKKPIKKELLTVIYTLQRTHLLFHCCVPVSFGSKDGSRLPPLCGANRTL